MDRPSGITYVNNKEICLKDIHSVVLLGDNGCRPPTKESAAIFSRILKIKTDLFVILGDLVFKGGGQEFRKLFAFCKKRVKVPILALAGNHDLPGYAQFCGTSTYAIILDHIGFICLDNSRKKFAKKDIAFLEKELKKHKEKRFFVLFHIPPPNKCHESHIDDVEWKKVRRVLDKYKERIICLFCGHIHAFVDYRIDGYRIFISGGGGVKLFGLKHDLLKAHHAVKLGFLSKESVTFNAISVDRKVTGQSAKYLSMKLR